MTEKEYIFNNTLLMKEWDWIKNNELGFNPKILTKYSNKKVWWICNNNHSWQDTIANRSNNRGCPYCSGHRVWKGFNDLATTNAELCKEWDYDGNNGHYPTEFSKGSSFRADWVCSKGHKFKSTIANRTVLKRGCPYCAGRYAIEGENDLLTTNPELASEWDYDNNSMTPSQTLPNSPKKVWWICKFGHSWQASIYSRNKGNGCPYCSHEKLDKTYSLAVLNPDLARRLHPRKNGDLSPEDVFPHSNKKYWWICEKGHEFEASVSNMSRNFSCPECTKELKTSFPEQSIFYYILQRYNDAINRFVEGGYEIDVYVPSLKIGIEYDGLIYHTSDTKTKEDRKDTYYSKQGIKIIRIKETKESIKDTDLIIWHRINSSYSNLNDCIKRLFIKLDISDFDIDINRDAAKISALYLSLEREKSIYNRYPLLLKEWDFEKNGYLNPQYVLEKSTKPIWWICKKGHSYKMSPAKRTVRNQGCPYCSGRYPTEYNNLQVRFPTISEEWNYDKNGDSSPRDYTPASGKKVWWTCNVCGYEYQMSIASKTSNGQGCPNCSKTKRLDSFNLTIVGKNGSFGQKHPDLLKEWDYSRNNVSPFEIPEYSEIKVWWICEVCGNGWESAVRNRSISHGCPICSKKRKAMKHCKPVLMYTKDGVFVKKFDSLTEAGKEIGKDSSSISFCCNGKTKTAYGYVWRYEGKK